MTWKPPEKKESNEGLRSGEKTEWEQDTKTLEGINAPGAERFVSQWTHVERKVE